MTYDQGREMTQQSILTNQADVKLDFARPSGSWEQDINENTTACSGSGYQKKDLATSPSNNSIKESSRSTPAPEISR